MRVATAPITLGAPAREAMLTLLAERLANEPDFPVQETLFRVTADHRQSAHCKLAAA